MESAGHWFDVCKCPCEFAPSTTFVVCDGVIAYQIRNRKYREVSRWAKCIDFRSVQRKTLARRSQDKFRVLYERAEIKTIGGLYDFQRRGSRFMAELAKLVGDIRGIDFAPINQVADDLSYWSAELPGKVSARVKAKYTYGSYQLIETYVYANKIDGI